MKILTIQEIESFLKSIASDYDVRVPIRLHDGSRSLGKVGEGPLAIAGGRLTLKITHVFFPQMESVLTMDNNGVETQKAPAKPIFAAGLRRRSDCLKHIDRFTVKITATTCISINAIMRDRLCFGTMRTGRRIFKIAGGNAILSLFATATITCCAYTERARRWQRKPAADADETLLRQLQKESDALPKDDLELIQKASKLLLDGKVR
jgi:hypothetical protein